MRRRAGWLPDAPEAVAELLADACGPSGLRERLRPCFSRREACKRNLMHSSPSPRPAKLPSGGLPALVWHKESGPPSFSVSGQKLKVFHLRAAISNLRRILREATKRN